MTTEKDVKDEKEEVDVIHTKKKQVEADSDTDSEKGSSGGIKYLSFFIGFGFLLAIAALLYYEYSGNNVSNYVASLQGKHQATDVSTSNTDESVNSSNQPISPVASPYAAYTTQANARPNSQPNDWAREMPAASTNAAQAQINSADSQTDNSVQAFNANPSATDSRFFNEPEWVEKQRNELMQKQRDFQNEMTQRRQEMFQQQQQQQQEMYQRQQQLQKEMMQSQQALIEQQRALSNQAMPYYNHFNQPSGFSPYPMPAGNGAAVNRLPQQGEVVQNQATQQAQAFKQPNYTYNYPPQAYYNTRPYYAYPVYPRYVYPQPWGAPVYR